MLHSQSLVNIPEQQRVLGNKRDSLSVWVLMALDWHVLEQCSHAQLLVFRELV